MIRIHWKGILISTALVVTSCASTQGPEVSDEDIDSERLKQLGARFSNRQTYQQKLDNIAYPIKVAALDFCEDDQAFTLGLALYNHFSFGASTNNITAAQDELGLTNNLSVQWVIEGSPTANLGIEAGDEIVSINNNIIPEGKKSLKMYRKYLSEAFDEDRDIHLEMKRGDDSMSYDIVADKTCDYPASVALSGAINASATGSRINVNSGTLNQLDDDLVALIIAHEIAHNTNHHVGKTMGKVFLAGVAGYALGPSIGLAAWDGAIISALFSTRIGSSSLEREADYVGLYIIAQTDINLENLAEVWNTMSSEGRGGMKDHFLSSHPSYPYRYVFMQETIAEIESKRQQGQTVMPNLK